MNVTTFTVFRGVNVNSGGIAPAAAQFPAFGQGPLPPVASGGWGRWKRWGIPFRWTKQQTAPS